MLELVWVNCIKKDPSCFHNSIKIVSILNVDRYIFNYININYM